MCALKKTAFINTLESDSFKVLVTFHRSLITKSLLNAK